MGELVVLLVTAIGVAAAGVLIMLVAEVLLNNTARASGFSFEEGRYNLLRAQKPHVLRGDDCGHAVVITYGLGTYMGEGLDWAISTIAYGIPPHPKVHFQISPRGVFESGGIRSGDWWFDRWVRVEGSPKKLLKGLVEDEKRRIALKSRISPMVSFTSTMRLTRTGPLRLRHKSMFLSSRALKKDLALLREVAAFLEERGHLVLALEPPNNSLEPTRRGAFDPIAACPGCCARVGPGLPIPPSGSVRVR